MASVVAEGMASVVASGVEKKRNVFDDVVQLLSGVWVQAPMHLNGGVEDGVSRFVLGIAQKTGRGLEICIEQLVSYASAVGDWDDTLVLNVSDPVDVVLVWVVLPILVALELVGDVEVRVGHERRYFYSTVDGGVSDPSFDCACLEFRELARHFPAFSVGQNTAREFVSDSRRTMREQVLRGRVQRTGGGLQDAEQKARVLGLVEYFCDPRTVLLAWWTATAVSEHGALHLRRSERYEFVSKEGWVASVEDGGVARFFVFGGMDGQRLLVGNLTSAAFRISGGITQHGAVSHQLQFYLGHLTVTLGVKELQYWFEFEEDIQAAVALLSAVLEHAAGGVCVDVLAVKRGAARGGGADVRGVSSGLGPQWDGLIVELSAGCAVAGSGGLRYHGVRVRAPHVRIPFAERRWLQGAAFGLGGVATNHLAAAFGT